jgi:hypothetical protein
MKYFSENDIREFVSEREATYLFTHSTPLNIRLCHDCPNFERDHPTIETDGDFGYCAYKTDFTVLDDEPIHWYFTDINNFCNEDEIGENDAL